MQRYGVLLLRIYMYLYLHGIVIEACTGNCTMGPIKQSSKRLSTIWVVALCMLTRDCNLSEEYRGRMAVFYVLEND